MEDSGESVWEGHFIKPLSQPLVRFHLLLVLARPNLEWKSRSQGNCVENTWDVKGSLMNLWLARDANEPEWGRQWNVYLESGSFPNPLSLRVGRLFDMRELHNVSIYLSLYLRKYIISIFWMLGRLLDQLPEPYPLSTLHEQTLNLVKYPNMLWLHIYFGYLYQFSQFYSMPWDNLVDKNKIGTS
jgi:hypothetical protein